jgi:PAS domain-containing protein
MICDELGPVSGWASFFWTAFERSANPMVLLQSDRVLVAVNDAFVTAFEYGRDALLGRRSDLLVAPEEWRRPEIEWSARCETAGRRANASSSAPTAATSGFSTPCNGRWSPEA